MGTIADKLEYTAQAREEIRAAIVAKGVDCPGTAPFCTFDEYIAQIGDTTTVPVLRMPLDGSLSYTGTLDCTVSTSGEGITFDEDAFSATTYSSIKLALDTPLDECTIALDFKVNSAGLSKYPLLRRLLWCLGTEETILRTGISYNDVTLANHFNFEDNILEEQLTDDNWHTLIIRKIGRGLICEVDGIAYYAIGVYSEYATLDTIVLSHDDYSLNGYIKNLRIYDTFDAT